MNRLSCLRPLGRIVLLCAVVSGLAACGSETAFGGGDTKEVAALRPVIGASLAERMAAMQPADTLEVVVTFRGKEGMKSAQVDSLKAMGLKGIYFQRLPIAGVVANRAQIDALAQRADIRSLWHNDELQYDNEDARYLTSVDQAQAAPELVNAEGQPITGKGVTIFVNDSGVDGLHPDLMNKVVANAIGHTDLRGVSEEEMLPSTPTECPVPCNTDLLGSHGTHVAGIAGGDGSNSGGRFAGAAKGAGIAAYGSGATLLVLSTIGGFDYALKLVEERPDLNLRIVTNSFGSTGDQATPFNPDDPTNVATKILADRNVVIVFSAGNSGSGPGSITGNFKKAPWVLLAGNGEKTGLLAPSSSRGALVDAVYEVEIDGERMLVEDRPTVVTPGTNIVSARAVAADPFTPLDLADDAQQGDIPPQNLLFYTHKSGTSMAAPHLAGLTALLLEANPALTWRELKQIFKQTATNMPGYDPWEAGAGFANVEAALAMALNLRGDYGAVNHALRAFNAAIPVGGLVSSETQTLTFLPAGPNGTYEFEVGPEIALVIGVMEFTAPCTCAVVLIDPAGRERGSSIALPVLSPRVSAVATGVPGTWTLLVHGIGGVSGVDVDPLDATNGYAGPSIVDVQLDQLAWGEAFGLGDVVGHPAQSFIEAAIKERLMDSLADGFKPDAALTRAQFAEYLMAWGVRQTRAHTPGNKFADIPAGAAIEHAAAEAVTRIGQLIMDRSPEAAPLLPLDGTAFEPGAAVTREQVAYALMQATGQGAAAKSHEDNAQLVAFDGDYVMVEVVDADQVDPALKGYVQQAILYGVLDVEFFEQDGVRKARANPKAGMTRAEYATAAVETFTVVPFP